MMKTKLLNEIFSVNYGNKFDFNKMEVADKVSGGINFVGRSSQNHGVSGYVMPIPGVQPYPAGSITVSLGGSKLLSSFVQLEQFYTAQNVAVLHEKETMSFAEKLFICISIRHNRFRYSAFGREANRTLRTLPVPDPQEFPAWVKEVDVTALQEAFEKSLEGPSDPLVPKAWKPFKLDDVFELKKGRRQTKAHLQAGDVPFISSIDSNNGLRQRIASIADHPAGVLTVNYNGSVAEAFFQPVPFCASDDVNVLYPRFKEMDALIGLFICTLIRLEKYRFNYGRKWNLERMRESIIRLPIDKNGNVDTDYMRHYMSGLPFSSNLTQAVGNDFVATGVSPD